MSRKSQPAPQDFLPLALPIFQMLLVLGEGERHGYAMKREILKRTGGKINLGPGVLYGSINKMLEQGFIVESEERPDSHLDDERRRYYRITDFGRLVAQAEGARLRELVDMAEARFGLPEAAR
jgi:DNA-binding PadR family transcriptional regulator